MFTYQELKALYGITNIKTDEEFQKEFSEHFFYANVCQFCSNFDVCLKRCSNCDGMFYCSDSHISKHWPEHKEFCNVLNKLKNTAHKKYLFQDCYMGDLGRRMYFIDLAEGELKKKLMPYQQNMFLFPRVCLVCYESNPGVVNSCRYCPHANFCLKHIGQKEDGSEHRSKGCSRFAHAFYLDQHWIVFKDLPLDRFVHALPRNCTTIRLPTNMITFMEQFVISYQRSMDFNSKEVKALVSTVFTRTLTVIYALQELNLTLYTHLVVHIICNRKFVEKNFEEWEILLHWLPRLNYLKICFIGSEISSKHYVFLCNHCEDKTLLIDNSKLSYLEYSKKNRHKSHPHVIVAFDVDINTHCTWINASNILTSPKTPIVLTAMDEAHLNAAAINCVKNPEQFSRIEVNPYKSLKLERFLNKVSYSNTFISIYPNLTEKICGVDNPINACNDCYDCTVRETLRIELQITRREKENRNQDLKNKIELYKQQIKLEKQRQNIYLQSFKQIKLSLDEFRLHLTDTVPKMLQLVKIDEELG